MKQFDKYELQGKTSTDGDSPCYPDALSLMLLKYRLSLGASIHMPTTMREVAKRAGVSLKTVSRVVNGEVKVSPQTKAKILDVIRQLDFAPNLAARRLSHGKAMAIGLVLGWSLNSTYSSAMTDFIFKSCKEQGYSLVLFSNDENLESQVLQACLGKQVDGIILDTIVVKRKELRTKLDS